MRKSVQRRLVIVLLLAFLTAFMTQGSIIAEEMKITFSDVSQNDSYYAAAYKLVNSGIMTCQQLDAKTMVGNFNPYGTISEAEFLSLIANVVCTPEEIKKESASFGVKYENYVQATVNKGIISQLEKNYKCNDSGGRLLIAEPITREIAAAYLTRADFYLTRDYKYPVILPDRIKDFDKVSYQYQITVLKACSLGIIGLSKGNFNPKAKITRAEAAVYINRLIDKKARVKVDLKDALTYEQMNTVQPVDAKDLYTDKENPYRYTGPYADKFYEYDEHLEVNRAPMVIYAVNPTKTWPIPGDVFVKPDGTRVTVKVGPAGILGQNQGCDFYSEVVGPKTGYTFKRGNLGGTEFGNARLGQPYMIDEDTGEGHWRGDWLDIADYLVKESIKIKNPKDGQILGGFLKYYSEYRDWFFIGPVYY